MSDTIRHVGFPRLRIEILIVVRNYGFVDHVELIPPSQLLRVNVTVASSVLLPSSHEHRDLIASRKNDIRYSEVIRSLWIEARIAPKVELLPIQSQHSLESNCVRRVRVLARPRTYANNHLFTADVMCYRYADATAW
jgi:hypothetical protein